MIKTILNLKILGRLVK